MLIEHLLLLAITMARASSMAILYHYDTSVSFSTEAALSLLPLVGNLWVYSFVVFQWSAVYWNACRGGSVGEADFGSSSIVRLRIAFYLVMSA